MLSFGLRTRRTPSVLCATPPFNSSTKRLSRLPFRRPEKLPPPPLRGVVSRGARSFAATSIAIAFGAGVGFIAYENYQPFRHTVLAIVRCSRVASE